MMVSVPARAALAGNPSDLHGGAVLAIPVGQLTATVTASGATGVDPPNALISAALARARSELGVQWSTTVPRSVGLAGSSALVIAALRAVDVFADPLELAQLALAIERDDLGIVAGLQDRATQAFNAPVLVDVSANTPDVRVLTPAQPLSFVVAWRPGAAEDSGDYHRSVAVDQGAMEELASIARQAADAFERGEAEQLAALIDASARTRARAAPLSAAHEALALAARRAGFRPNSAGSGGAIVAVLEANPERIGADFVVETFR